MRRLYSDHPTGTSHQPGSGPSYPPAEKYWSEGHPSNHRGVGFPGYGALYYASGTSTCLFNDTLSFMPGMSCYDVHGFYSRLEPQIIDSCTEDKEKHTLHLKAPKHG